VPAVSIYAGKWAAVDEELIKEGRLKRVSSVAELHELRVQKKQAANPRRSVEVIGEVVRHILE
jgi:predicted glycosyltransferase